MTEEEINEIPRSLGGAIFPDFKGMARSAPIKIFGPSKIIGGIGKHLELLDVKYTILRRMVRMSYDNWEMKSMLDFFELKTVEDIKKTVDPKLWRSHSE